MTTSSVDGRSRPAQEGAGARRWRPPLRWVRGTISLILLFVVIAGAVAAREAVALRDDLVRAQEQFDAAVAVADPLLADFGSFRDAQAALDQAATHLAAGDAALASAQRRRDRLGPVVGLGQHLPGWPRGLADVDPLIAAARDLARTGLTLRDAFTTLTTRLDRRTGTAGADEPIGARLAAGLTEAEPAFARALATLDRAIQSRGRVQAGRLHGPLGAGSRAAATFDRRVPAIRDNLVLLAQLPPAARALLGMEGPRTYAILGQNSAELRPTGGFIGSLGLLTLDQGRVVREDYRGSYTFDNPIRGFEPLPPAMADHLGPGGWALRDANWSPDFPTSAAKVEEILARHQDVRVDGVIGFTSFTVGLLLETLGPVAVAGLDAPITASDWYQLAERAIYFRDPARPFEGAEQNKGEVLEPVLRAVIDRVQNASADDLPRVLQALQRAVRERQLLISLHDAAPARMARQYQADGRLAPPASGDVLAVVDANLSYSKVGPHIQERIAYEVWLNARGVAEKSQLTVTYQNALTDAEARANPRIDGSEYDATSATFRRSPGIFGTYVRVYVPRNARILGFDGEPPLLGNELGMTSLERYYRVPVSSTTSFRYTYQIPTDVGPPGEYRLRLIKQPGTTGHELEVRLHLPPGVGALPQAALSRGLMQEGADVVYRGALTEDLDLAVRLLPPSPGP